MKQFDHVNGKYGAPMGRAEFGHAEDCAPKSVRLFHVNLSQGYDDGGAYWGGPTGGHDQLFCAQGEDFQRFTRASSRDHAALLLEIPDGQLAKGCSDYHFGRYSASLEYHGKAAPGYRVSDFGQYLKHVDSFEDLCGFARG